MDITLTKASGGSSKSFSVLSVKWHTEDEDVEFHNSFQNTSDDGTLYENIDAYRKIITINFGAKSMLSLTDRQFIVDWMKDITRTVTIGIVDIPVALDDIKGFAFSWVNNLSIAKSLVVKLKQKTATVV